MRAESAVDPRVPGEGRIADFGAVQMRLGDDCRVLVVGFTGHSPPDAATLHHCRRHLREAVQKNGCEVVAFDLAGMRSSDSCLLGLIAATWRMGAEVHVLGASEQIRESLRITRLDEIIVVRDAPGDGPAHPASTGSSIPSGT